MGAGYLHSFVILEKGSRTSQRLLREGFILAKFTLKGRADGMYNNFRGSLAPYSALNLETILKLAQEIYKVCSPVGMGFLQSYDETDLSKKNLKDYEGNAKSYLDYFEDDWKERGKLNMDYVNGRQVKLTINRPYDFDETDHGNVFFGDKSRPVEILKAAFEAIGHELVFEEAPAEATV